MKTLKLSHLLLFTLSVLIVILVYKAVDKEDDDILAGAREIKVQLQWFHGAQFCGLYVADQLGYFKEEGIQITLIPVNSFTSDPIALLNEGLVDIAIGTGDQVLLHGELGMDIKAFGNVFNRSVACYMFKKGTINNLHDFKGKKIAVFKTFDTENILRALDKKHSLEIDFKDDVIQAVNIDAFVNGEIDIYGSYLINEPIDMRLKGELVEVLDPVNHGIEFYSDTYIAKRTYIEENREYLKKFIRAAAKGWKYCKENPDLAVDIMFERIKNKTKDEHYDKELMALKATCEFLGDGRKKYYFYMSRKKWELMEQSLFDIGRLPKTGYIKSLCDFDLVPEANENNLPN